MFGVFMSIFTLGLNGIANVVENHNDNVKRQKAIRNGELWYIDHNGAVRESSNGHQYFRTTASNGDDVLVDLDDNNRVVRNFSLENRIKSFNSDAEWYKKQRAKGKKFVEKIFHSYKDKGYTYINTETLEECKNIWFIIKDKKTKMKIGLVEFYQTKNGKLYEKYEGTCKYAKYIMENFDKLEIEKDDIFPDVSGTIYLEVY